MFNGKVMVATDGSSVSERAVETAAELARELNAELIAVSVAAPYPYSAVGESSALAGADYQSTVGAEASARLARATEIARLRGIACQTSMQETAEVHRGILAAADQSGAGLIVMASHGDAGLVRIGARLGDPAPCWLTPPFRYSSSDDGNPTPKRTARVDGRLRRLQHSGARASRCAARFGTPWRPAPAASVAASPRPLRMASSTRAARSHARGLEAQCGRTDPRRQSRATLRRSSASPTTGSDRRRGDRRSQRSGGVVADHPVSGHQVAGPEGAGFAEVSVATAGPSRALLMRGNLVFSETWLVQNDGRFQVRTLALPQE